MTRSRVAYLKIVEVDGDDRPQVFFGQDAARMVVQPEPQFVNPVGANGDAGGV